MRTPRLLLILAVIGAGLFLPAVGEAAPLQFFTETTPAGAAFTGTGYQPLVGDYNGDGASDVFFYKPGSGAESLRVGGSRTTFVATTTAAMAVSGTYQPLLGDFDGNGRTDIFWYAPGTAADHLWLLKTGTFGYTDVPVSVGGTYRPLVGDFASSDEAGRDDIFWYAPGRGADSLWRGTGSGRFSSIAQSVAGTYTPVVGAFTPDPATGGSTDSTLDIFWYAPGTTGDSLWRGDGTGHFSSKAYTVNGTYRPIVGFFDGFGVQDIFWYSSSGSDSVWLADPDTKAFTAHSATIGAGFTPIVDEFTIPDEPILWWSPTGVDDFWLPQGEPGTWDYSTLANNTNMGSGYQPITGDFDGDGHNDIDWLAAGSKADPIWWGPG